MNGVKRAQMVRLKSPSWFQEGYLPPRLAVDLGGGGVPSYLFCSGSRDLGRTHQFGGGLPPSPGRKKEDSVFPWFFTSSRSCAQFCIFCLFLLPQDAVFFTLSCLFWVSASRPRATEKDFGVFSTGVGLTPARDR